MGLYFNTSATNEMISKVNAQFSARNIGFWQQASRRKEFDSVGGKKLHLVAGGSAVQPSDPAAKARWFQWLKDIQSGANSAGDQISALLFLHLGRPNRCVEIVFVVNPTSSTTVTVSDTQVFSGSKYTEVITIHTATARAVRNAIKARMKTRKRRARKKA